MNWAILKYLECDYFFSPNRKGRLRKKIFSLANSFFSCNNISVTNNKGILWSWVLLKCLTEVNFCLADKNGSLLWCNQVTPLLCGSYQTFNINMTFCVLLSEAYASSSMKDNSVWQRGCWTILLSVFSTSCYLEEHHIIDELCINAKRVSLLLGVISSNEKRPGILPEMQLRGMQDRTGPKPWGCVSPVVNTS